MLPRRMGLKAWKQEAGGKVSGGEMMVQTEREKTLLTVLMAK